MVAGFMGFGIKSEFFARTFALRSCPPSKFHFLPLQSALSELHYTFNSQGGQWCLLAPCLLHAVFLLGISWMRSSLRGECLSFKTSSHVTGSVSHSSSAMISLPTPSHQNKSFPVCASSLSQSLCSKTFLIVPRNSSLFFPWWHILLLDHEFWKSQSKYVNGLPLVAFSSELTCGNHLINIWGIKGRYINDERIHSFIHKLIQVLLSSYKML